MKKINCDVSSCSHYKNGVCYANRVNIGGENPKNKFSTCCGSFLNNLVYSELTNSYSQSGNCDCIVCYTETCSYNKECLCTLDTINVSGGSDVAIYTQTYCSSFKK